MLIYYFFYFCSFCFRISFSSAIVFIWLVTSLVIVQLSLSLSVCSPSQLLSISFPLISPFGCFVSSTSPSVYKLIRSYCSSLAPHIIITIFMPIYFPIVYWSSRSRSSLHVLCSLRSTLQVSFCLFLLKKSLLFSKVRSCTLIKVLCVFNLFSHSAKNAGQLLATLAVTVTFSISSAVVRNKLRKQGHGQGRAYSLHLTICPPAAACVCSWSLSWSVAKNRLTGWATCRRYCIMCWFYSSDRLKDSDLDVVMK